MLDDEQENDMDVVAEQNDEPEKDISRYTFDEGFQEKILGLLVQDRDYLVSYGAEVVKPYYFDNVVFRNTTSWLLDYANRYHESASQDVLINEVRTAVSKGFILDGDVGLYLQLFDRIFSMEVDEIDYIRDQTVEFAKKQALRDALIKSVAIYEKGGSTTEIMREIEHVSMIGAGQERHLNFQEDILRLPDILKEKYDPSKLFRTGIESLDKALEGGMAPGEVHVFCGRTGGGKSKLASILSTVALAQRKNVVYITLEIDESMVMANVANRITGMSQFELVHLAARDRVIFEERVEKVRLLKQNIHVKFYPEKTVSTRQIRAFLARLKLVDEFVPDLIIIDYADCLLPSMAPTRDAKSYEVMGAVFSDLSQLANNYKCPLITISQVNRDGLKTKTIDIGVIADSAQKAHKAFSIISINETPAEMQAGRMRLYTAKMRRGITAATIYCNFDRERCQLSEAEEKWDVNDYMDLSK